MGFPAKFLALTGAPEVKFFLDFWRVILERFGILFSFVFLVSRTERCQSAQLHQERNCASAPIQGAQEVPQEPAR